MAGFNRKKTAVTEVAAGLKELSGEVEGAAGMRKQELMFAVLKQLAAKDVQITGTGVVEVLQDRQAAFVRTEFSDRVLCKTPDSTVTTGTKTPNPTTRNPAGPVTASTPRTPRTTATGTPRRPSRRCPAMRASTSTARCPRGADSRAKC